MQAIMFSGVYQEDRDKAIEGKKFSHHKNNVKKTVGDSEEINMSPGELLHSCGERDYDSERELRSGRRM